MTPSKAITQLFQIKTRFWDRIKLTYDIVSSSFVSHTVETFKLAMIIYNGPGLLNRCRRAGWRVFLIGTPSIAAVVAFLGTLSVSPVIAIMHGFLKWHGSRLKAQMLDTSILTVPDGLPVDSANPAELPTINKQKFMHMCSEAPKHRKPLRDCGVVLNTLDEYMLVPILLSSDEDKTQPAESRPDIIYGLFPYTEAVTPNGAVRTRGANSRPVALLIPSQEQAALWQAMARRNDFFIGHLPPRCRYAEAIAPHLTKKNPYCITLHRHAVSDGTRPWFQASGMADIAPQDDSLNAIIGAFSGFGEAKAIETDVLRESQQWQLAAAPVSVTTGSMFCNPLPEHAPASSLAASHTVTTPEPDTYYRL